MTGNSYIVASDQAFTLNSDPLIDQKADEIIEQPGDDEVLDSTDLADPVGMLFAVI